MQKKIESGEFDIFLSYCPHFELFTPILINNLKYFYYAITKVGFILFFKFSYEKIIHTLYPRLFVI